jgi:hypothetical protein
MMRESLITNLVAGFRRCNPTRPPKLTPFSARNHASPAVCWVWLVDGLLEHGYRVHLVNTAAIHQHGGLTYPDDHSEARWLAHLLRLAVLSEGDIYPLCNESVYVIVPCHRKRLTA